MGGCTWLSWCMVNSSSLAGVQGRDDRKVIFVTPVAFILYGLSAVHAFFSL